MIHSPQRWLFAGLSLLFCLTAAGQGLSFAQPPLDVQSVGLAIWPLAEGGNGHFYEAVASPRGINWADAESYATAHGGYLATLTSDRENTFVFKLIDSAQFWLNSPTGDSWGPWLGGKNSPVANDGETWQWLNDEGPFAYRNWRNPPDESKPDPDQRLIFFGPGKNSRQPTWGQAPAGQLLHGFVVEYDTNPLPSTLKYVALFAVSIVGLIAVGSIIYFIVSARRGRSAESLRHD